MVVVAVCASSAPGWQSAIKSTHRVQFLIMLMLFRPGKTYAAGHLPTGK